MTSLSIFAKEAQKGKIINFSRLILLCCCHCCSQSMIDYSCYFSLLLISFPSSLCPPPIKHFPSLFLLFASTEMWNFFSLSFISHRIPSIHSYAAAAFFRSYKSRRSVNYNDLWVLPFPLSHSQLSAAVIKKYKKSIWRITKNIHEPFREGWDEKKYYNNGRKKLISLS